ncbi:MAG: FAD-dependent oxidoreductase [bacterium]|nr:FAD-dependent oxidoreductase [bacterium]
MALKVLEPIKVGKLTIRNRFLMAPMLTQLSSPDGHTTSRMVDHYRRRAAGGVGAITIEIHFVRDDGKVCYSGHRGESGGLPDIGDDSYIPDVARIVQGIHSEGAVCFLQLGHLGKFGRGEILPAVSESSPPVFTPAILKELSTQEVEDYIQLYVDASFRAKQAGCDGVTVHSSHGFFHMQFLSPHSNRREDKWGKDKTLCAKETVRRIKEKCGQDFPVVYRISGDEFYEDLGIDDGYGVEDFKKMVPELVKAGVDMLDVTGGTVDTNKWIIPSGQVKQGCFLHLGAAAKSVCKIPVSCVGRINTPELAEKAVQEGKCDMVTLGRALFADPDFVKKLAEGRPEEIRRCLACNHCINYSKNLIDGVQKGSIVKCAVNAELGRDEEYAIRPKAKNRLKKVFIAGGGPAGMEAARVATLRGHDVTLFEKSDRLGGQMFEASVPPGKSEMINLVEFLTTQMKKLKVKVKLSTPLTEEILEKEKPEVLVIATGSRPIKPRIPGLEKAVFARDVLLGKVKAGQNVVIVGGALVGCETAAWLREQGKDVQIVEILPQICSESPILEKFTMIQRMTSSGICLNCSTVVVEINDKGVMVESGGERRTIEADTVIIAAGAQSNKELWSVRGSGNVTEFIARVGDATKPGLIVDAIHEASAVARDF